VAIRWLGIQVCWARWVGAGGTDTSETRGTARICGESCVHTTAHIGRQMWLTILRTVVNIRDTFLTNLNIIFSTLNLFKMFTTHKYNFSTQY
jgi:hypothetical protein